MEKSDQFCFGHGMTDMLFIYLRADYSTYWSETQKSLKQKIFGVLSRMLMLMEATEAYRDHIREIIECK